MSGSTLAALALGILGGIALALVLVQPACCSSLGKAALGKAGLPDLGGPINSVAGGLAAPFV